ncbi:hypothetical protein ACP3V3_02535 [Vibrio sp. PNB22_3_1]
METLSLLTDGQATVVNFVGRMLILGLVVGFWSTINYLVMIKLKLINGTQILPWQSAITAFLLADILNIFNRTIESSILSGAVQCLIISGAALLTWTFTKRHQIKT